ncbi:MAG: hypothetical protein D6725_10710 [Planctomycetota bacterium]|nr:MAG: hypothetical protein D6725_10710 [Planctomycetota bacterium]
MVESCAGCGAPGEIIEGEIVPGCSGCGGTIEGCSGCGGAVEGCSGCGGTIETSPTCSICGGSHATFSGTIETFQPSGPVSPAPPAEADKPSEARPEGTPKRQYEPDTDIPQPPTARQMQWVPRQSL